MKREDLIEMIELGLELYISGGRDLRAAATAALTAIEAAGMDRNSALEDAAKACERQQQEFLSDHYALGQPASTFGERFACGSCAAAIRNMKE